MEYLPPEIQLKIFQNLSFDELFLIKQTNQHFYTFINKHEGNLANKRFQKLTFIILRNLASKRCFLTFRNLKEIKLKPIDFPVNNQLKEKWQSYLDKQITIPLYLNIKEINIYCSSHFLDEKLALLFYAKEEFSQEKNLFTLKLPLFPKSIEELKIIRYWLNQIARCDFEYIIFIKYIFNPEMIKLLFDNNEIIKFKCNIAKLFMNMNINFTIDNLIVSKYIRIEFHNFGGIHQINTENFLLKLLLNEGNRIPQVRFICRGNQIQFYNQLINQLEKATDFSKVVSNINFLLRSQEWPSSELIVKGVETSESTENEVIMDLLYR